VYELSFIIENGGVYEGCAFEKHHR
jgi:hypothetical protein